LVSTQIHDRDACLRRELVGNAQEDRCAWWLEGAL